MYETVNYFIVSSHVLYQYGSSALMMAARGGLTDIVVELVKAGANLDLQNNV